MVYIQEGIGMHARKLSMIKNRVVKRGKIAIQPEKRVRKARKETKKIMEN